MLGLPISSVKVRHFNNHLHEHSIDYIDSGLDKLNIATNFVNFKLFKNEHRKWFSTKLYQKAFSYNHDGIRANVFRGVLNGHYAHKLEMNPSDYSSYSKMMERLETILGDDGLAEHEITRYDPEVCFPSELVPVDLLFHTLRVRSKQKVSRFRDTLLEFKFGVCSGFSMGRYPNRDLPPKKWTRDLSRFC